MTGNSLPIAQGPAPAQCKAKKNQGEEKKETVERVDFQKSSLRRTFSTLSPQQRLSDLPFFQVSSWLVKIKEEKEKKRPPNSTSPDQTGYEVRK